MSDLGLILNLDSGSQTLILLVKGMGVVPILLLLSNCSSGFIHDVIVLVIKIIQGHFQSKSRLEFVSCYQHCLHLAEVRDSSIFF